MNKKRLMREGNTYWDPDTGLIYNLQGEVVGQDAVYRVKEQPKIDLNDYDIQDVTKEENSYDYEGDSYTYLLNLSKNLNTDTYAQAPWPVNKFEYVSWSYRDFDLPTRATSGSAGYDFHSPKDIIIQPGETVRFSLEVKAQVKPGQFLMIVPRSSLGFKGLNHIALTNTTGIIDSDYYNNPDNEGVIDVKLHNFGIDKFTIHKNDKIVQGIFVNFDITCDDEATEKRAGGFGSTGK